MSRSRQKILLVLFVNFFTGFCFFSCAAADTLTITTYYPSVYGVYNESRSKRVAIGDDYIDSTAYCWEGTCTTNIGTTNTNLIVEGNVGIGTAVPAMKLQVNGNGTYAATFMNGNVGIGTLTPTQALDVKGYIKSNNPFFIASSVDGYRSAASGWVTVVHDHVLAGNLGGYYNPGNGTFTAPVKGLYLFTAQNYICSSVSGATYLHHLIGVNGNWDGNGYSSNSGGYSIFGENMGNYDSSTTTTTFLYLNAGDRVNDNVYLSCPSTCNYMYGSYSFFQGILLFAG